LSYGTQDRSKGSSCFAPFYPPLNATCQPTISLRLKGCNSFLDQILSYRKRARGYLGSKSQCSLSSNSRPAIGPRNKFTVIKAHPNHIQVDNLVCPSILGYLALNATLKQAQPGKGTVNLPNLWEWAESIRVKSYFEIST
jgi:hypothetical protein